MPKARVRYVVADTREAGGPVAEKRRKKVYCMDLGTGTLDVLYRDPDKLAENQTRYVAPSPALVHMARAEAAGEVLYVDGWIVGGGPFAKALDARVKAGKRTILHPSVSAIVKNNEAVVRAKGIEISETCPPGADRIFADELKLDDQRRILAMMGDGPIEGWAIAVQDHGGSDDGLPDRVHRFSEFKALLAKEPRLVDFAAKGPEELSPSFRRLRTCCAYLEKHGGGLPYVVMDTVFCGLLGCLLSVPREDATSLLVNIGNSHITATVVRAGAILALFEHHTRVFKKEPDRLLHWLAEFARGVHTEDGVRHDGGCGAWYRDHGRELAIDAARVSGPRREILAGRVLPGGVVAEEAFARVDAMMVGPLGLAAAFDARHG